AVEFAACAGNAEKLAVGFAIQPADRKGAIGRPGKLMQIHFDPIAIARRGWNKLERHASIIAAERGGGVERAVLIDREIPLRRLSLGAGEIIQNSISPLRPFRCGRREPENNAAVEMRSAEGCCAVEIALLVEDDPGQGTRAIIWRAREFVQNRFLPGAARFRWTQLENGSE